MADRSRTKPEEIPPNKVRTLIVGGLRGLSPRERNRHKSQARADFCCPQPSHSHEGVIALQEAAPPPRASRKLGRRRPRLGILLALRLRFISHPLPSIASNDMATQACIPWRATRTHLEVSVCLLRARKNKPRTLVALSPARTPRWMCISRSSSSSPR